MAYIGFEPSSSGLQAWWANHYTWLYTTVVAKCPGDNLTWSEWNNHRQIVPGFHNITIMLAKILETQVIEQYGMVNTLSYYVNLGRSLQSYQYSMVHKLHAFSNTGGWPLRTQHRTHHTITKLGGGGHWNQNNNTLQTPSNHLTGETTGVWGTTLLNWDHSQPFYCCKHHPIISLGRPLESEEPHCWIETTHGHFTVANTIQSYN